MSRTVNSEMPSRSLVQVKLSCSGNYQTVAALIDSGVDESLLDMTLAQLGLGQVVLEKPFDATALDGRLLFRVTHRSTPLEIIISGNHTETHFT